MNMQQNDKRESTELTAHKTEAEVFITDLLSELQSIARIDGLDVLSEDISNILTKHN